PRASLPAPRRDPGARFVARAVERPGRAERCSFAPGGPAPRDRDPCYSRAMTTDTRTTPQVGEVAPDVTLPDETGAVHHLSDQKGRWTVLYFYPKDDTPGCNTEACQFRDLDADYAATDA